MLVGWLDGLMFGCLKWSNDGDKYSVESTRSLFYIYVHLRHGYGDDDDDEESESM